jgi:hypothetical protein
MLHVPPGTEELYAAAPVWKDFRFQNAMLIVSPETKSSVQVTCFNRTLTVTSPSDEWVAVYSVSGSLIYNARKTSGTAVYHIGDLPQGLLIVRGSSGWVKKIAHY